MPTLVAGYITTRPRLWGHLGGTLAIVGLGTVFFMGLNPSAHRPRVPVPRDLYLKAYESLPVRDIDVVGRPFWGNPNARVKIVEFSDFQCPFCRRAAFTLKPYLKAHQDDVALYFVNFPLDPTCNPMIEQAGHPVSCLAAKASVCAAKQGRFWDYHDLAFENQSRLSRSVLVELASKAQLDGPAFETCLASDEALDFVKKDVEQGSRIPVQGTPSIFINGRLFRDWPDPERIRMVIEHERAKR
jgi:protein-disulfide isomerase